MARSRSESGGGRWGQHSTRISPTALGGPTRLRGQLVLADEHQVSDARWWADPMHKNIKLIVQCTHRAQTFHYPACVFNEMKCKHVYVDPRNDKIRQLELDKAMPLIEETLARGEDVLLHCKQSFHRCPVVTAAVVQRLCGTPGQVYL